MAKCVEYLGKNLKRLISQSGLSQARLAEIAGISTAYLSQVIHGKNEGPNLDTLERIAEALNTTVSDLFMDPEAERVHSVEECWHRVGEAIRKKQPDH